MIVLSESLRHSNKPTKKFLEIKLEIHIDGIVFKFREGPGLASIIGFPKLPVTGYRKSCWNSLSDYSHRE